MSTTTIQPPTNKCEGDKICEWLDVKMNFIYVMIIVIAVLSVFGLCLFIYIIKYPSYDYPEKLQKRNKHHPRTIKDM